MCLSRLEWFVPEAIDYGGHTVTHYGTRMLQVIHRNESVMSTFHVVKQNGPRPTIIGLPTCRALKLVTLKYAMNIGPTAERDTDTTAAVHTHTTRPKEDETAKTHILNEYADVFDGIGCFEGEYHINTRLNCAVSSAFST